MDGWLDSPNSGICMHVFQNTLISFVRLYGNSSECQSVSLAAEEQLLSTIKVLVATSCWQILNQINLSIIIVWMDDWTLQTQVYARICIRMSLYSLLLDYGNASECRKWDLLCYKKKFISTLDCRDWRASHPQIELSWQLLLFNFGYSQDVILPYCVHCYDRSQMVWSMAIKALEFLNNVMWVTMRY